ncbi:hypothetical protein DM02DRAFT_645976 [Periconia macrospinosa]|uniref:Phosphatidate phosphatase APP1 catalytic domain-containing protein n=1 Tax=Periconia macrospinosa TaxID=97972 RepID=A0A2V1DB00_9PLEO|nr:hypothetical protein DM02DRAFT_645976 [Periconia macrospinosa]
MRRLRQPKPLEEASFEGKTVIVTGATSGIGLEAVVKFAALGAAKVIMAARDMKKGDSTKAAIEDRLGKKGQLEVWELDMNSYDSIVAFSKQAETLETLDVVILNAGVRRAKYVQSAHGWEDDLQVNTLSTTLLSILLLPKLQSSKKSTERTGVLEFVNSSFHQTAMLPPKAKQSNIMEFYNKPENFAEGSQYSYSKLFLMHAARVLSSKVSPKDVIITSICPGASATNLARDHEFPGMSVFFFIPALLLFNPPAIAANVILTGTAQGEESHGGFWNQDKLQPLGPALTGGENAKLGDQIWHEMLYEHPPSWMPKPHFRKPSSARGTPSFLRYLIPHRTTQRARAHLSKFRLETFPSLKHRAQSRIYKYILYRQARKLQRKPGVIQQLRGTTRKLLGGSNYLDHEARIRRQRLTQDSNIGEHKGKAMSYQESYAPREPGARRKKLAGYLKAANELRQTYQQQYAPNWTRGESSYNYGDDTPGEFQDAAVVRSGEEEMILFPSYARKHVKRKPEAEPGTIQEVPGDGRDARDSGGAGDAEFWNQQWNNYEDDNAIVDVDVRGWIYSPHKGQMSRKQRLFIGLARQLVGVQAPPAGAQSSNASESSWGSRDPSPGYADQAQIRQAQRDEQRTQKEAEEILRKGEREAEAAAKGAYSERPASRDTDNAREYRTDSTGHPRVRELSKSPSQNSLRADDKGSTIAKRASWNQPADMSAAELVEANARLMARLRHFLAMPMANTPISVFFYNDEISKQRTIYTNPSGHFNISAALDFIPTHVRVLASDRLSATEEVVVTKSAGISVISDIDDTIKHSAISSGAREIFRNAFIRDLEDLTIDGVKEWYNRMAELGVTFHYVSNSPWQLFPVISKYFSLAGLPPGSFHLKQYSGMLQGIFEPVAERKKGTLDKIARDFPERKFILIGDSGEADLEVYTDFVLENPGRVIGVFIRDVTTTESSGFFDPSIGPMAVGQSSPPSKDGNGNSTRQQASSEDDDPELRAAIAASLRDMEETDRNRPKSIFPQLEQDRPSRRPGLPARATQSTSEPSFAAGDLIDLSPEENVRAPTIRRVKTDTTPILGDPQVSVSSTKTAPLPPKKPISLRTASGDNASQSSPSKAPPPPKPRKPASYVQSSPLSQQTVAPHASPKPPLPPKPDFASQQSYAGMAREKLNSVYNSLPSTSSYLNSYNAPAEHVENKKQAPPPPPPRRGVTSYPAQAASYVGAKANSAWQYAPPIPHHSRPPTQAQPYSTTSNLQSFNRSNTNSSLSTNGGYGDNGPVLSKKEQLWRERWARAERVLAEHRVALKSWRVGSDAVEEAEKLIQRHTEEEGNNNGRNGRGGT